MSNINTRLVHGAVDGDPVTGAVNVPIYQTSTYRQPELGRNTGYEYSRTGNPTREALEKQIADLEGGTAGFAFASGMAAIDAVLRLYGSGRTVIISSNVYGGTFRILDKVFSRFGLGYRIVDTADLGAVEKSITPDVSALLIESPANPLMTVTDIAAVSEIARDRGIHTIVDNTFMTPYLQRPIGLGADIVVHSATKYIGGHSDLVAGLAVVNDGELAERLHFVQNATGGILQPFDSFLALRGIKTLGVRMDRHVSNAEQIAEHLQGHPAVSKIYYPGLRTDPGYGVNRKQASAGGGMISFELNEGYDHRAFLSSTELIALAESLGGVESLLCHPASMTHASIPADIRRAVGITDRLIRLSVGIEDGNDIIADLEAAFGRSKLV
ncbi:MAG: PLP-dependent aspartate aminotransferase family protein [Candidatus Methanoplasma sp.]|jgi:cystathionine beta-lyase|nr:PLP-dependent aspartate aminotransferase family protein [Candidatus Methanoplasma sp.]